MGFVEVEARIASTHPVMKYGGIRLSEEALRELGTALNEGRTPMNFGHSPLEAIEVRDLVAKIVELEDGEHALEATFEVEEEAWKAVEGKFAAAGAPGGFSFTASEPQIPSAGGDRP